MRPGQGNRRWIIFPGFILSGLYRATELGRMLCWSVFGVEWGRDEKTHHNFSLPLLQRCLAGPRAYQQFIGEVQGWELGGSRSFPRPPKSWWGPVSEVCPSPAHSAWLLMKVFDIPLCKRTTGFPYRLSWNWTKCESILSLLIFLPPKYACCHLGHRGLLSPACQK